MSRDCILSKWELTVPGLANRCSFWQHQRCSKCRLWWECN